MISTLRHTYKYPGTETFRNIETVRIFNNMGLEIFEKKFITHFLMQVS